MDRQEQLENNFSHHPPTEEKLERYDSIRHQSKDLAQLLVEACPDSRELSLALTKLEECCFWANASIARNE